MQFDSFENINWDRIKKSIENAKVVKKIGKYNPKYLDLSVSFDTETTNMKVEGEKFAFMYVWQFSIDGYFCYGRTWQEFIQLLTNLKNYGELSNDKRIIIYVHNLGFEFQFFRKYIPWDNVFSKEEREPMKAVSLFGIEFRDSLILSGYKLETLANNLVSHRIPKMVGDLDYSLIRNSKTKFTEKEKGYMLNDVRILDAYIDEQREEYGDIAHIPLTNTGRVRQKLRENCFGKTKTSRLKFQNNVKSLTLDEETYIELKQAFAGGFTHANPNHVGKTYHNVASIDFTSSYPTVMLAEKFPSSKANSYNFTNMDDFEKLCEKRLVIFQVEFKNLISTIDFDNYISRNRCIDINEYVENNGRIFSAESLTTVITNIDWDIIKKVYTWDDIKISRVKWFRKHYLPKEIMKTILYFYKAKTELKGVNGKEAEYMHGKQMLNSVYGASVSDIIHDEVIYNNDWNTEPADAIKQLEKYNTSNNRVLYYAYGVFVTAYARHNLFEGILSIGNDYLYSDTDSIKMLNYEKHKSFVDDYNKRITEKLDEAMKFYRIDVEATRPKTIKGVKKPLGVWDFEGVYDSFKTLGAKRYVYTEKGKLYITIAGLGKKQGAEYLLEISNNDPEKAVRNFKNNFTVPAGKTGKLTHTYIDEYKEFFRKRLSRTCNKRICYEFGTLGAS